MLAFFLTDAVRPFGSFASKLYAKSGDLDVSVQLSNDSGFPNDKKKKEIALKKLGIALQTKGNFFVGPCSCDHNERFVLLCICLINL